MAEDERTGTKRGQIFALVIGIAILASGLIFMLMGHPKTGGAIIGSVLVTGMATFAFGRAKPGSNDVDQSMPRVSDELGEDGETAELPAPKSDS